MLLSLSISAAFLMEGLDSTIMVSAIPAIATDFGIEPLRINLALSIYLMTLAAVIPASAWMADRFGAKRVFLWAMAAFMLLSIGAAMAQNLTTLVVMRALQAVAGALMTPVGRLLLIRAAPKDQLASAIAWMSTPALIGPVLGPLIGGYVVTYLSWHWIFFVKIPFGVAGLVLAARLLPPDTVGERYNFDFQGFVYCAAFLGATQMLLEQLVHVFLPMPVIMAMLVALPICALSYARHMGTRATPVLDLTLLKLRLFRIGFFGGGLSRLGFNALPFLFQLQLQIGFGWSAADAGWIVFIVAASAIALKPMMRRVLAQLGFKMTLLGNAMLGAVTIALIGFIKPDTPIALTICVVFLFGAMRSLQFNTTNTLLFADIPRARQSASTSLGGVGQQLSMGLGISVAAVLVAQLQDMGINVPAHAISVSIFITAALTAVSGLIFLGLKHADGADVSRHRAYIAGS
ncbi:MFS transporter [Agrobacterium cavarae]|uniref:MFS transporter n=1 Tax=Agrobacterium cavarae TaxID=2528239 RepID=UPI003FD0491D